MKLPLLSKEEFLVFSDEFQLAYIDRHGRLIYFRILDENLSVSVYAISEFKIRVLKTFPEGLFIEIRVLSKQSEHIKYLGLMYRN